MCASPIIFLIFAIPHMYKYVRFGVGMHCWLCIVYEAGTLQMLLFTVVKTVVWLADVLSMFMYWIWSDD